ncbi:hypothetical protein Sste5346_007859 [Sporothrix stenoceras]|uniref:Siderophore biosynthesis enzyme n=1 Tax=Sporothrix stenoceras TaxID=5173 RepID=A0ABR3YRQ3_9PEZI
MLSRVILAGLLPAVALARTDLTGCTSSVSGASLIWYVPGTGELCEFIDCGGGRAPPITTKPGCAGYTGTATVTPSFLPGFGGDAVASSTAVESTPSAAASSSAAGGDAAGSGTTTSDAPTTTSTTDVNQSQPGVVVISGSSGTTTTIAPSVTPAAGGNGTNSSLPPGIIVTDGKTSTVYGTNKPPTKTTSGVTASTAGAVALSGAGGLLGAAAAIGVAALL